MKKLILALTLLSTLNAFADIVYHNDCVVHNNTLTITDSENNLAENSPESILIEKGYVIVTSTDPNDSFSDVIQLNYSPLSVDGYNVSVELVFPERGLDQVFHAGGDHVSDAVRKLPECRTY